MVYPQGIQCFGCTPTALLWRFLKDGGCTATEKQHSRTQQETQVLQHDIGKAQCIVSIDDVQGRCCTLSGCVQAQACA